MRNPSAQLTAATLALVLVVGASCEREPSRRGREKAPPAGARQPTRRGQYHMSARGLQRIRQNESFIPKIYDDGVGNQTIGYGHLVRPGESFAGGITEPQALDLLAKDVAGIVGPALERITVPLTQNQVDALGSFIYNVGPGNFQRSVLPEVNSGDHVGVTAAMVEYTKGRNRRTGERLALRGLIQRRLEEIALYKAPTGGVAFAFPGQEWSRAARRLLANTTQFLPGKPACLLEACRESSSPS